MPPVYCLGVLLIQHFTVDHKRTPETASVPVASDNTRGKCLSAVGKQTDLTGSSLYCCNHYNDKTVFKNTLMALRICA